MIERLYYLRIRKAFVYMDKGFSILFEIYRFFKIDLLQLWLLGQEHLFYFRGAF